MIHSYNVLLAKGRWRCLGKAVERGLQLEIPPIARVGPLLSLCRNGTSRWQLDIADNVPYIRQQSCINGQLPSTFHILPVHPTSLTKLNVKPDSSLELPLRETLLKTSLTIRHHVPFHA